MEQTQSAEMWHIVEVEDNWVRDLLFQEPRRFHSAARYEKHAGASTIEGGTAGLLSRSAGALPPAAGHPATPADFDTVVTDLHFGPLAVRALRGGVVTSFAWHAGQIALTVRLLRGGTPESSLCHSLLEFDANHAGLCRTSLAQMSGSVRLFEWAVTGDLVRRDADRYYTTGAAYVMTLRH